MISEWTDYAFINNFFLNLPIFLFNWQFLSASEMCRMEKTKY